MVALEFVKRVLLLKEESDNLISDNFENDLVI